MTKFLILFSAILLTVYTRTAEEWRSRTIYQIVTDRFGRTDDESIVCNDLTNYCGGTWKGIEKNLDYIQGIGADAIWISPVVKNRPGGYHGYWTINFYELNENFGTEQDLKDLINACHERGMYIMVDVVPNHVAPVPHDEDLKNYDFSGIYPFNDKKFYHWPSTPVCKFIDDYYPTNQTALEYCWLLDLPDLNHEDPYVTDTLIEWITNFIQTYNVDGLRLDAVRHIPKWFWKRFTDAAGVYTIGEVWNHDVPYCAGYQEVMDSLMNFPFHGTLDQVFLQDLSMKLLTKHYETGIEKWKDMSVLGNFVVNHDFPRFLNTTPDMAIYKAYYTYVLTSVGIPIIYYGDEQSFTGGADPLNRETMWGKMNPEAEMYQYIKSILDYKKKSNYHSYEQIERYVDDNFYAFSRGDSFFAFSNLDGVQTRKISTHPYAEDTWLCSVLSGKECVQVKDGEFEVTIINKQPQILAPHEVIDHGAQKHSHWKHLKAIWQSIFALQPQMKDFSFYKNCQK